MNAVHKERNRHPVDELADVREAIKALEERADQLKADISRMMGAADALGGDQYIAYQRASKRKGALDAAALEAAFGDLSRYRKPDTVVITLAIEPRIREPV